MGQIKDSHGGHYGKNMYDVGAVGNGYKEAEVAHRINELICQFAGVPDTTDYLGTSVAQILGNTTANMNRRPGDWHISNHLNAFNGTANGFEVWYWAGDTASYNKAKQICDEICRITGMVNRGPKATIDLYVLRNSTGRTLLIEWGFIDNAGDIKKMLDNMEACAKALVKIFGYSVPTTAPEPSVPKPQQSKGGTNMQCTFQIDNKATHYYFNGVDKIVALNHPDQLGVLKLIYRDNNGREMPHYKWSSSAPWYARLKQAADMANWNGKPI